MNSLFSRERLRISGQEDSLSLTTSLGLHNESTVSFLVYLSYKFFEVSGQVVRLREKVVVVWKNCL